MLRLGCGTVAPLSNLDFAPAVAGLRCGRCCESFIQRFKTMSDNEVILRLSTVALLVGYLTYMQWGRARKRAAFRRQFHRAGEVIDVAPLRPRLDEVRRNYTASAHAQARGIHARENLVASARQKLSQLPFFRDHPAEPQGEHHVA